MSSISGVNNSIMGTIMPQGAQSRPDPAEKFKELDADGSGGLDKTELSALAKELAKMAGKTLDVDASITTYDADGDGQLSQEEMDTMMKETMGPPPEPPETSGTTSAQQASNAYLANSGEDRLDLLRQLLEKLSGDLP